MMMLTSNIKREAGQSFRLHHFSNAFLASAGLAVFVALPSTAHAQDSHLADRERAIRLIDALVEKQNSIKAGHYRIECETLLYRTGSSEAKQLEGSVRRYELWNDLSRMRIDIDESRPTNKKDELHSQAVFTGDKYLINPSLRQDVAADETPAGENQTAPLNFQDSRFDLRQLGLIPTPFADLVRREPAYLKLLTEAAANVTVDSGESGGARLELKMPAGDTISMRLDESAGGHPVMVEQRSTGEDGAVIMVERIESEWVRIRQAGRDALWLPKIVEYRRWERENLTLHERVTLVESHPNEEPAARLFTWEGMNLPFGKAVVIHGEEEKVVQWNGTTFEPWTPKPLVIPSTEKRVVLRHDDDRSSKLLYLIGVNLVAGLVVFAFWLWRRVSGTRG